MKTTHARALLAAAVRAQGAHAHLLAGRTEAARIDAEDAIRLIRLAMGEPTQAEKLAEYRRREADGMRNVAPRDDDFDAAVRDGRITDERRGG